MEPSKDPGPAPDVVRSMFDRLADRYDLFNRLTSLGLDGVWRRRTLSGARAGMRVLDLGCGTGDLALDLARRFGGGIEGTGLDLSERMLAVAERRRERLGMTAAEGPRFVRGSAEELPIDERRYDLIVSGFVLRNLRSRLDRVLEGVRASLARGGRIAFLDFTEPPNPVLRALWRFYMNSVVALYGRALFGKDFPAFYMTDSAARFDKPEAFKARLEAAGFESVRVRRFLFGVIALYEASAPAERQAVIAGAREFGNW